MKSRAMNPGATPDTELEKGRVRKRGTEDAINNVLLMSKRRCCLCFGLRDDAQIKEGQIAHIDRDSSHSEEDNLVFLCLDHHNAYDTVPRQTKRHTPTEVRQYRDQLYRTIGRRRVTFDLRLSGDREHIGKAMKVLERLGGGLEIELKRIRDGSVILTLESDLTSFQAIKRAFEEGTLGSELGREVLALVESRDSQIDAILDLGEELLERKAFSDALACMRRAVELDPDSGAGWSGIAAALLGLYRVTERGSLTNARLREAHVSASRALDLCPQESWTWFNQGIILFELGQYEDALRHMDEAIRLDPKDPMPWFNKGVMFKNTGRDREAVVALEAAEKLGYHEAGLALGEMKRAPSGSHRPRHR